MIHKSLQKRIEAIQKKLNVGGHGLVSPVTVSKLETLVGAAPDPSHCSLTASRCGLELIVDFEIGSESYYSRSLARPSWPGGASGVTIGIGYDLGYHPKSVIEKDWSRALSERDVTRIVRVQGLRGEAARTAARRLRKTDLRIPLAAAREVFNSSSLPAYAVKTRRVYEGVQDLPPDAQAMLLSLVYNRGASLSGSSRREMKAIQSFVPKGDLAGIAEQIRSMKRLWEGKGLDGLLKRREIEAATVEGSDRTYRPDEIVSL